MGPAEGETEGFDVVGLKVGDTVGVEVVGEMVGTTVGDTDGFAVGKAEKKRMIKK